MEANILLWDANTLLDAILDEDLRKNKLSPLFVLYHYDFHYYVSLDRTRFLVSHLSLSTPFWCGYGEGEGVDTPDYVN